MDYQRDPFGVVIKAVLWEDELRPLKYIAEDLENAWTSLQEDAPEALNHNQPYYRSVIPIAGGKHVHIPVKIWDESIQMESIPRMAKYMNECAEVFTLRELLVLKDGDDVKGCDVGFLTDRKWDKDECDWKVRKLWTSQVFPVGPPVGLRHATLHVMFKMMVGETIDECWGTDSDVQDQMMDFSKVWTSRLSNDILQVLSRGVMTRTIVDPEFDRRLQEARRAFQPYLGFSDGLDEHLVFSTDSYSNPTHFSVCYCYIDKQTAVKSVMLDHEIFGWNVFYHETMSINLLHRAYLYGFTETTSYGPAPADPLADGRYEHLTDSTIKQARDWAQKEIFKPCSRLVLLDLLCKTMSRLTNVYYKFVDLILDHLELLGCVRVDGSDCDMVLMLDRTIQASGLRQGTSYRAVSLLGRIRLSDRLEKMGEVEKVD